ncbi:MAG: hypothetical protein L0K86_04850 [Actinomycetia bacterium]|nr:hypothetical protein [Actinomycetes bacterium]
MALAFGVLGPLEVHRDGLLVRLPSGRRRAVLAALLVRANRPVPADALIEAAWGADRPAEPRSALRTVLSRLRSALGAGCVRLDPAGYVLVVGPDALDAARFATLCSRAATAVPAVAAGLLDEALSLWRGPAYAEFADRDAFAPEAVKLEEMQCAALEHRAELALDLGDAQAAVIGLEGLIAQHPLRERARGLLMTAVCQVGRPAEALDRYRDYRTWLADELGLDPSPTLRDLEVRILGHGLPGVAAPRRRPHPTVSPISLSRDMPLIGRDDAVAALLDALAARRLVTVTGVGGVGKTRLAAEVLHRLAETGNAHVVVELADVAVGQVDTAVATALGFRAGTGPVRVALLEYLSITSVLLVLDNCEHVIDQVRSLVESVLRGCPRVRLLATSRRRLGPVAEQVLPLAPLPTPGPGTAPDEAESTAAVRMFIDRIRRIRPAFALNPETLPAVSDICRRLDGLPLALEFAATRAASLGLEPLRSRLDSSLRLLGEGGQSRRSTLDAVVDWSYRLLEPQDRRLFAALSVFDGGFDLAAAEQVSGRLGGRQAAVGLARLLDASLVSAHEVAGGTRYRMLAIVRQFAADRLADSAQAQNTRLVHAEFVRSLVEHAARASAGSGSSAALARLRQDQRNVATAVRWALRTEHVELSGRITGALGLCPHWHPDAELLGLMGEVARHPALRSTSAASLALGAGALAATERGELDGAERLAAEALTRATTTEERCVALLTLGMTNAYAGQHDHSSAYCRRLLAVDGILDGFRVDAHACLALLAGYKGDRAEAQEQVAHARRAADAAGAEGSIAFATYVSGEIALLDEPEAAVPVLREAADQADRAGAVQVGSVARIALLSALIRQAEVREALVLVPLLLQDEHRMGRWPQLWTTVRLFAELLATCGLHEMASLLLAAADAAPSAPPVAGADVERYRLLRNQIDQEIGADRAGRIAVLARALPRVQILDRARAAADNLAGEAGSV